MTNLGSMKRFLSISLFTLLLSVGVLSPVNAAAKPIKTNFTNMPDLLNAMKAKGVSCTSYTKTPAEYVIEEGVCQFQGMKVLIDLWPTTSNAKSFLDALKKMPALLLPAGSESFIFYTNNYTLSIDGIPPDVTKAKSAANIIQKKLGIKYVVGKAKAVKSKTKTQEPKPAPSTSKSPTAQVAGSWAKPFGWDAAITESGFKLRLTSFKTNVTEELCKAKKELEDATPDNNNLILVGEICPQAFDDRFNSNKAKSEDYAILNLQYTNETQEIGYPRSFSLFFKVADSQGKIYETVLLSYQDSKSLEIDAVPGATVSTEVYFQLPKSFTSKGSKIEVSTNSGNFYWSIS